MYHLIKQKIDYSNYHRNYSIREIEYKFNHFSIGIFIYSCFQN